MWYGSSRNRDNSGVKVDLYLSLGSNQGDRRKNIEDALSCLNIEFKAQYKAVSSIIETEPWGFASDNAFLNAVVEIDTPHTPHELLRITQTIEREMGRTHKSAGGVYSDRIIDIDILLYEDLAINEPDLTIPHPLMWQRKFVYDPLLEIAPHLKQW